MSVLPLVAVDIGNSSTKLGWSFSFSSAGGLPAASQTAGFATGQTPSQALANEFPELPLRWLVASVHREGAKVLAQWVRQHRAADAFQLLTFRDLPIEVRTLAPERVGVDRLAAAVAANTIRQPNRPAIVIDAGSAITVDLVTRDGAFAGGAILPGFRMSAQALYGADLLPLAELAPNDEPPPALGRDTAGAIRSGLFWGAVGSVRELVARLSVTLDQQPEIFVTGGDLRQLAAHLPGAQYVPHMVLAGIAIAAGYARAGDS